jgi:hypothetical protein
LFSFFSLPPFSHSSIQEQVAVAVAAPSIIFPKPSGSGEGKMMLVQVTEHPEKAR